MLIVNYFDVDFGERMVYIYKTEPLFHPNKKAQHENHENKKCQ